MPAIVGDSMPREHGSLGPSKDENQADSCCEKLSLLLP